MKLESELNGRVGVLEEELLAPCTSYRHAITIKSRIAATTDMNLIAAGKIENYRELRITVVLRVGKAGTKSSGLFHFDLLVACP